MRFEDKATLNILARASTSVFLLASSVIMVRYLSKEDYGTFLQLMLILNTVIMLAFVGLPQSIFYYYPQTRDRRHLVRQTLLIGFSISILAAAIVFFSKNVLASWLNNPGLAYFGDIISLLIFCQGPIAFRDPILLSQNALVLNSIATLISCMLNFIPLFIGLFLGVDLRGILLIFLCSNIVNLFIFLGMIAFILRGSDSDGITSIENNKLRHKISVWEQIRYSFPIGLATYIGVIGKQLDKYIISVFFLPAQFAVYSRGAMEVPLIDNVTYTLNDMTMPRYVAAYAKGDLVEFLRLMHANIDKVAKINFGVFIFLFFEASLLMEVLYTKAYLSATPIFQVYLFLLFLSVTVYGMIPRVTGKTRQLTLATSISVILNIILSLLLIPVIGPVGAAVGTILGSVGYMGFLLLCAAKDLSISWRLIMPWSSLFKTMAAAIFPIVLLWGYHSTLSYMSVSRSAWVLIGAFAIYTYGYLFTLNFMGLLQKEDRDYFFRWLRFDLFVLMPRRKKDGVSS